LIPCALEIFLLTYLLTHHYRPADTSSLEW